MRWAWLAACAALLLPTAAPRADIPKDKIKFGIIQSAGPQTERTAHGAVAAAQMAAEDFEARSFSLDTEIKHYDSNRPDHALDEVRDWVEKEHIDAVIDVAATAEAASIARLMNDRHRLFIVANLGGPDLEQRVAGPTTLIWGVAPTALSHSVVRALADRGGDSWFFSIGSDPLAQSLAADAARFVKARGRTVKGMATHALGMRDFGPELRKADKSGAKVIALSEIGPELNDAVTEAAWIGLPARHQVAALFAPLPAIEQIGLQAAQGMVVAEPFYWDRNDASRTFAQRYARRVHQRMPTQTEAIVYSATTAMLHAAAAAHSVDAAKIIAELRRKPIPDDLLGTITVGPDRVARHDIYVFRVKRPGQSQRHWDDLIQLATIPAAEAFEKPPPVAPPPEHMVEQKESGPPKQKPPEQAPAGRPPGHPSAAPPTANQQATKQSPSTHEAPRQLPPNPAMEGQPTPPLPGSKPAGQPAAGQTAQPAQQERAQQAQPSQQHEQQQSAPSSGAQTPSSANAPWEQPAHNGKASESEPQGSSPARKPTSSSAHSQTSRPPAAAGTATQTVPISLSYAEPRQVQPALQARHVHGRDIDGPAESLTGAGLRRSQRHAGLPLTAAEAADMTGNARLTTTTTGTGARER